MGKLRVKLDTGATKFVTELSRTDAHTSIYGTNALENTPENRTKLRRILAIQGATNTIEILD